MNTQMDIVFAELSKAVVNGYEIGRWSPDRIADDLVAMSGACKELPRDELLRHITSYLKARQTAAEVS